MTEVMCPPQFPETIGPDAKKQKIDNFEDRMKALREEAKDFAHERNQKLHLQLNNWRKISINETADEELIEGTGLKEGANFIAEKSLPDVPQLLEATTHVTQSHLVHMDDVPNPGHFKLPAGSSKPCSSATSPKTSPTASGATGGIPSRVIFSWGEEQINRNAMESLPRERAGAHRGFMYLAHTSQPTFHDLMTYNEGEPVARYQAELKTTATFGLLGSGAFLDGTHLSRMPGNGLCGKWVPKHHSTQPMQELDDDEYPLQEDDPPSDMYVDLSFCPTQGFSAPQHVSPLHPANKSQEPWTDPVGGEVGGCNYDGLSKLRLSTGREYSEYRVGGYPHHQGDHYGWEFEEEEGQHSSNSAEERSLCRSRNRESARRSRKKRKEHLQYLEHHVQELSQVTAGKEAQLRALQHQQRSLLHQLGRSLVPHYSHLNNSGVEGLSSPIGLISVAQMNRVGMLISQLASLSSERDEQLQELVKTGYGPNERGILRTTYGPQQREMYKNGHGLQERDVQNHLLPCRVQLAHDSTVMDGPQDSNSAWLNSLDCWLEDLL